MGNQQTYLIVSGGGGGTRSKQGKSEHGKVSNTSGGKYSKGNKGRHSSNTARKAVGGGEMMLTGKNRGLIAKNN